MSIKFKASMALAILSVIACVLSLSNYLESRHNVFAFQEALESASIIDDLLEAGGSWAVERGVTFSALSDRKPVSPQRMEKILAFRKKGEVAYMRALTKLQVVDDSETKKLIDATQEAFERMQDLRRLAGTELILPQAERDPSLFKSWIPAACDAIEKSQQIRFELTKRAGSIDAELGRQTQLRHYSWVMSEFAGRERAIIGGTLASGNKMSFGVVEKLGLFRGRFELGRSTVNRLMKTSNAQVQKVCKASEYFLAGDFQELRKSILKAGVSDGNYPVDSSQWIKESTEAINTILAVQKASTEESSQYVESNISKLKTASRISFFISIAVVFVAAIATLIVFRSILNPLSNLTATTQELAQGNLDMTIPYTDLPDEIGQLAVGLNQFKLSLLEHRQLEAEENAKAEKRRKLEESRAELELRTLEEQRQRNEEELQRAAKIDKLLDRFSTQIGEFMNGMTKSVDGLMKNSGILLALAEDTDTGVGSLTGQIQTMESIIANIEEATENMSSTVEEVEQSVNNTESMITDVSSITHQADELAVEFNGASDKVGQAVEMIGTIANQTKMLAINAGIEAARAGDEGKGFAVVASQVKTLATSTKSSVSEIDQVVTDMQSVSKTMAGALRDIGSSMASVQGAASRITSAISRQRAGSENIVHAIRKSASISANVAGASRNLACQASETTNASSNVSQITTDLVQRSQKLEAFISEFLDDIRSL